MIQTNQTKSNKIALMLLVFGAIFWLGAINVRALIGNELLNYDQFNFKTSIPPDRENTLFQLMANSSVVIISAYFVVLITSVWFLKSTHLKIKQNGWLLMSAILFYLFVPVETYTYYLDIKFALLYHSNPPNHDELLRIFGKRLGALSGIPVIAIFCYYTIVGLAIFRPLSKKPADTADEEKEAG